MNVTKMIQKLGGTGAVATLFEIKAPSVSEWKQRNAIPKARLQTLRLLHPELFKQVRRTK